MLKYIDSLAIKKKSRNVLTNEQIRQDDELQTRDEMKQNEN